MTKKELAQYLLQSLNMGLGAFMQGETSYTNSFDCKIMEDLMKEELNCNNFSYQKLTGSITYKIIPNIIQLTTIIHSSLISEDLRPGKYNIIIAEHNNIAILPTNL